MFFFKRKTAYELRISDWSSDVCSSDLRARPHRLAQPVEAGAGGAELVPLRVPQRQHGDVDVGGGATVAEQPGSSVREGRFDRAPRLVQGRHRQGLHRLVVGVAHPVVVRVVITDVGGIDRGGTRSEEHTSELQSLMRISYAVFCLKKK